MKKILLVACLLFVWCISAGSASASITNSLGYICTYHSDQPSFKGWVTIDARDCSDGLPQTADCKGVVGWKWTGADWVRGPGFGECSPMENVYAYPFGSGWSWVWTKTKGWQAIQSKYVRISMYQPPDLAHALH